MKKKGDPTKTNGLCGEKEKKNCVRRFHASGMQPSNSYFDVAGILREYGRRKRCIDRCFEQLDEEERLLLEMIYIVPKIGNLEKLCGELGVEKSSVYRRRDKALQRFSEVYAAVKAGM